MLKNLTNIGFLKFDNVDLGPNKFLEKQKGRRHYSVILGGYAPPQWIRSGFLLAGIFKQDPLSCRGDHICPLSFDLISWTFPLFSKWYKYPIFHMPKSTVRELASWTPCIPINFLKFDLPRCGTKTCVCALHADSVMVWSRLPGRARK